MESFKSFKCLLILFVLCIMNLECYAQFLGLSEGKLFIFYIFTWRYYGRVFNIIYIKFNLYLNLGEICRVSGICKPLKNCASAVQGLKNNVRPILCSIKGSTAIVCCPQSNDINKISSTSSAVKTYTASESKYD